MKGILLIVIVLSIFMLIILFFDKVVCTLFKANKQQAEVIEQQKRWHRCLISGYGMPRYFLTNNIKTIGIYGYNVLGKQLFDELCETEVTVSYFIDGSKKNKWNFLPDCNIISFDEMDQYEKPDAIIISETGDCENERKLLESCYSGIILPISWLIGICMGL